MGKKKEINHLEECQKLVDNYCKQHKLSEKLNVISHEEYLQCREALCTMNRLSDIELICRFDVNRKRIMWNMRSYHHYGWRDMTLENRDCDIENEHHENKQL